MSIPLVSIRLPFRDARIRLIHQPSLGLLATQVRLFPEHFIQRGDGLSAGAGLPDGGVM